MLSVVHVGFDGRARTGQLVVNRDVAKPLVSVFRQLYSLRFPIRHMRLHDLRAERVPADLDVTARPNAARPCRCRARAERQRTLVEPRAGYAIDLNLRENSRRLWRDARPERPADLDRTRLRQGMVTAVVRAFASIGWGWGGSWSGSTKDYMHFSTNGH